MWVSFCRRGAAHLKILGHATPEFRCGVVYVVNAVYTMSTCRKKGLINVCPTNVDSRVNFVNTRINFVNITFRMS